ncbi:hypothetical protein C8R44DRAFT_738697 [Mycena epipterygia]|nr:hypothetical protein C8R44DRAFT_738697 [Mycena epipterygia]
MRAREGISLGHTCASPAHVHNNKKEALQDLAPAAGGYACADMRARRWVTSAHRHTCAGRRAWTCAGGLRVGGHACAALGHRPRGAIQCVHARTCVRGGGVQAVVEVPRTAIRARRAANVRRVRGAYCASRRGGHRVEKQVPIGAERAPLWLLTSHFSGHAGANNKAINNAIIISSGTSRKMACHTATHMSAPASILWLPATMPAIGEVEVGYACAGYACAGYACAVGWGMRARGMRARWGEEIKLVHGYACVGFGASCEREIKSVHGYACAGFGASCERVCVHGYACAGYACAGDA